MRHRFNYKYEIYDLTGELILQVNTIPMIAKCMGVSEYCINDRLKRKVTKYSEFKDEKYKFNVKRSNNGNN